ncbi:SDR family NAD(P)-dependent oxidoreductase [Pseudofrankia saprophytica]|uniref:SDR family NAD(P)-dependent oxidoreductase n=1 Tax=Pseudofrankia saprophytica TaxID=298655 RepID=UPI000234CCE2|nr:SDR family NAD(P)-dependent oxidoreductase [Pseudofrankia saprophytica]
MSRTYVVTGAASGIGRATAELLLDQGATVIGVDLKDTEVTVDLAARAGREELVDRVRELTGGRLDAVVACAGVSRRDPRTVRVNFFGAVATLTGLRPLLAAGTNPAAVVVDSVACLHPADPAIVAGCLAADEPAAVTAAQAAVDRGAGQLLYLAWLAGPHNSHVTGQVIFVDGGADAVLRGDSVW